MLHIQPEAQWDPLSQQKMDHSLPNGSLTTTTTLESRDQKAAEQQSRQSSPLSELSPPPDEQDNNDAGAVDGDKELKEEAENQREPGFVGNQNGLSTLNGKVASPPQAKDPHTPAQNNSNAVPFMPQTAQRPSSPASDNSKLGPTKVKLMLELNAELLTACLDFQTKGIPFQDIRYQHYSNRLKDNLTWLAYAAEAPVHRSSQVPPPPITDPPPLVDPPSTASMDKIRSIYTEMATLFAKEIAQRKMIAGATLNGTSDNINGTGMPNGLISGANSFNSLKRPASAEGEVNGANKRRDTGFGKGSSTLNSMGPPPLPASINGIHNANLNGSVPGSPAKGLSLSPPPTSKSNDSVVGVPGASTTPSISGEAAPPSISLVTSTESSNSPAKESEPDIVPSAASASVPPSPARSPQSDRKEGSEAPVPNERPPSAPVTPVTPTARTTRGRAQAQRAQEQKQKELQEQQQREREAATRQQTPIEKRKSPSVPPPTPTPAPGSGHGRQPSLPPQMQQQPMVQQFQPQQHQPIAGPSNPSGMQRPMSRAGSIAPQGYPQPFMQQPQQPVGMGMGMSQHPGQNQNAMNMGLVQQNMMGGMPNQQMQQSSLSAGPSNVGFNPQQQSPPHPQPPQPQHIQRTSTPNPNSSQHQSLYQNQNLSQNPQQHMNQNPNPNLNPNQGHGGGAPPQSQNQIPQSTLQNLPPQIQQFYLLLQQHPPHPFVGFMMKNVPGFAGMSIQEKLQRMAMAQQQMVASRQQESMHNNANANNNLMTSNPMNVQQHPSQASNPQPNLGQNSQNSAMGMGMNMTGMGGGMNQGGMGMSGMNVSGMGQHPSMQGQSSAVGQHPGGMNQQMRSMAQMNRGPMGMQQPQQGLGGPQHQQPSGMNAGGGMGMNMGGGMGMNMQGGAGTSGVSPQSHFGGMGQTSPTAPQQSQMGPSGGGMGMNPMSGMGGNMGMGVDPRAMNMDEQRRRQFLLLQQQAQRGAMGGNMGMSGGMGNPMSGGMSGNMGGGMNMGGMGGGMGGNMGGMNSSGMMMNSQQQQQQMLYLQQQQQERLRQHQQHQQQAASPHAMNSPMLPQSDMNFPALRSNSTIPGIARSARSPSDSAPSPMTPRMPSQRIVPNGQEEYQRLIMQQQRQQQQALAAQNQGGFNPQMGNWQAQIGAGQFRPQSTAPVGYGGAPSPPGPGMGGGMGMNGGGGQHQNWSTQGTYPFSPSPSSHQSDLTQTPRHMSSTPAPIPTAVGNSGVNPMMQTINPAVMLGDQSMPSDLELFNAWTQ